MSYKNLSDAELIDLVEKKIVDQGELCFGFVGPTLRCFYRLEKDDGTVTKCAFGHLIPDNKYEREMERKSSNYIFDHYPGVVSLFNTTQYELVAQLQTAHDIAVMNPSKSESLCIFKENIQKIRADRQT